MSPAGIPAHTQLRVDEQVANIAAGVEALAALSQEQVILHVLTRAQLEELLQANIRLAQVVLDEIGTER